jgi:hypothetical protein
MRNRKKTAAFWASTLNKEAIRFSEKSMNFYQNARPHIPEDVSTVSTVRTSYLKERKKYLPIFTYHTISDMWNNFAFNLSRVWNLVSLSKWRTSVTDVWKLSPEKKKFWPKFEGIYFRYYEEPLLYMSPSFIKIKISKNIWGFHGGNYEESSLLGCGAV